MDKYTDAEVEAIITAELVDGQSIDNAIDALIAATDHDDLPNPNGNPNEQHLTAAQVAALHTAVVAGDLNHNDLANLNAGDNYEHITQAQKDALHTAVVAGDLNHNELANLNDGDNYEHITQAQKDALHTAVVAGDLNHNELANLNDGDNYEHITQAQKDALHAVYTDAEAVQAVEDAGIILSASKTINIDGTPADASYTGIVLDIDTTGCATWDAVYIDGVNSCLPARANSINTMPCIGIVVAAGKVLVLGVVRIDATFVLAADKVVYVDEDTAGDIKDAVPGSAGDVVQVIGYTVGTDMLYVNPSLDWVIRQ